MRSLAGGDKGYKDFPKLLRSKFVFLNAYCTSLAAEKAPRGPDGPYQFVDKSVPVYVIKNWEGKTFVQELGYSSGDSATKALGRILKEVLKKNGAVSAPKQIKALTKIWKKAEASFQKKRPGYGWKELGKLLVLAHDKKKFADGVPTLGLKAQEKIAELEASFSKQLDAAIALGDSDYDGASKKMKSMMRTYGMVKPLKSRLNAALKALSKPPKK